MEIGIGAPVSGAWAGPDELARFGALAEELGYTSLWTFQRLLAPADGGGDPVYRSVLDPLLSLTYLASHTSRARLGVALVNLPFVSPTHLAKQASTLDVLSRGRLDLGLGIGWSPIEFIASNATTERRGARTVEFVAAMRALWSETPARFDGEFYTIPASRMEPKPVQRPGPPILLGGVVPAALERAGRIADGWMSRSGTVLADIAGDVATVRDAAERAGRDPDAVRIISRGVVRYDPSGAGTPDPDGKRLRLSGSAEQIREDAAWLAEQGVTELFYDLNWDPRIGDPAADRTGAVERAEEILRALRP
ncbi:TIGR03619 family F420-dependent LLM class oxidoreductase [Actinospica sp. MGRD01-02]|uniref:TIGR03619 family F420-dependent LLM class oxidoreductase n=1 Tax=Actinospica acidithermotolerans TaxID=2828514 RepID=A0A941EGK3_9ACTN|nr:TIGR03619 family F420-dependent LLM class oxidoreductase [Actinospica acidithermotolerans]MBR7830122.1 TIGR03619 family F420-dependent LLM class oxidoreductase [Actinospica acidithermotolerans]